MSARELGGWLAVRERFPAVVVVVVVMVVVDDAVLKVDFAGDGTFFGRAQARDLPPMTGWAKCNTVMLQCYATITNGSFDLFHRLRYQSNKIQKFVGLARMTPRAPVVYQL